MDSIFLNFSVLAREFLFFSGRFFILIFISFNILTPLDSLPIKHITLKENFQKIRISKIDYYAKVPTQDIFELIRLDEDHSSIRFLIPTDVLDRWHNLKIPFQSLPYPTKFSEIDPSIHTRLRKGCIPLKSMLNGYKTSSLNQLYLHCIEREFPGIAKRFHIGRSVQNRKITALRIRITPSLLSNTSNNNIVDKQDSTEKSKIERDPILFHCGIHGNEMIAIEHCYDIIQQLILNSSKYPNLSTMEIWVVPVLNPDGLDSHWFQTIHSGRTNARNIDLNRNFPFLWDSGIENASSGNPKSPYFRGFQAGSEPEVQAILQLMETKRFFFSMSIHCYANSVLIPYSIPETKNPKPNYLQEVGEKLIKNVNSQREDKPFLAKKNLYPVDGTDQDTFFHEFGTFAYLLETSHLVENYLYVPFILADIRPAWENLIQSNANSYKWKIQVLGENKNPLQAKISSSAYQYFHEERRETNQYGKYGEVVPNSNKIRVKITSPGYKSRIISVSPEKNPSRIVIELDRL